LNEGNWMKEGVNSEWILYHNFSADSIKKQGIGGGINSDLHQCNPSRIWTSIYIWIIQSIIYLDDRLLLYTHILMIINLLKS